MFITFWEGDSQTLPNKYFYNRFLIMKPFIVIGFFVMLNTFVLEAAETVISAREDRIFVIDYSGGGTAEKAVNNFFIRELAKHNLTSLYNTSFTYHYTLQKSLERVEPFTYRLDIKIAGDHFEGDIHYRDFNLSDILQPEQTGFKAIVEVDGNYIYSREFKDIPVDDENIFHVGFTFDAFVNEQNIEVNIEDIDFNSIEKDKSGFNKRISYIDNYYAALAAIEQSLERIGRIEISSTDPVDLFICISELERIYSRIRHSEFIDKLGLTRESHPGFFIKLTKLQNKIAGLHYFHDSKIGEVDFLRVSQSINEISEKYIDEVSRFYYLSQETTHAYQPYFYNLGMFSCQSSDLYRYIKGMNRILRKTGYCNDTDAIAGQLKQEIYNTYLERAKSLVDDEYYYLAKGLLTNAESFYKASIGEEMPLNFNILMSKITYGIYNSYVHLIDRAIDIGNYELAENYITKARDFQQGNSAIILSAKYIRSVSEKLVQLYISKGIRQNQNEEYREAIYCFEQAHDVCSNLGVFNQDYIIKHGLMKARTGYYNQLLAGAVEKLDEGEESVAYQYIGKANELDAKYDLSHADPGNFEFAQARFHQQVYLNLISKGRKYLQSGNYSMAFEKLLKALELEQAHNLEIYEPLPDLFSQAATPYMVYQCKLGEVKVKKNKMDEAREIYDRCLSMQTEYGLLYEPELNAGLAMLNNNIFARQCLLVAEQYEERIDAAENKVEGGDFIGAVDILKSSETLLKKNYFCEYDQSSVAYLIKQYQPASEYQILAGEAQDALSSGDNDSFVEIYRKMEELSNLHEVIRRKIEPLPLHYLFSVKNNLALLESSIAGYDNKEQYETALKILDVLESNNTSVREARNIQQQVAEKLARADKATASNVDPKKSVEKYTGGNSWYRHFRKAYIKNW